jgi:hypothetical protein
MIKSIAQWLLARGIKIGVQFVTVEPTYLKKLKYGIDVKGVPDAWAILSISAANGAWTVSAYAEVL